MCHCIIASKLLLVWPWTTKRFARVVKLTIAWLNNGQFCAITCLSDELAAEQVNFKELPVRWLSYQVFWGFGISKSPSKSH